MPFKVYKREKLSLAKGQNWHMSLYRWV